MLRETKLAATRPGKTIDLQSTADIRIFTSRHRAGLVLPDHIHDRACIGFVVEGQCEERLSTRVHDLSPHKSFFRPAGEIHANISGRTGFHCLITEVTEGWLEHVRDHAALPNQPVCVQNAELTWLSMRLYQECSLGGFASSLAIEGLMLEIAACLVREQRVDHSGQCLVWMKRAIEVLHAHFHEPMRLSTVASLVGIHPVHLAREFRKHHGYTVGQYVRRLRVESASHRLARHDSSLASIALEAGFSNQAHFCRVFKSVTGISPARYRASLKAR